MKHTLIIFSFILLSVISRSTNAMEEGIPEILRMEAQAGFSNEEIRQSMGCSFSVDMSILENIGLASASLGGESFEYEGRVVFKQNDCQITEQGCVVNVDNFVKQLKNHLPSRITVLSEKLRNYLSEKKGYNFTFNRKNIALVQNLYTDDFIELVRKYGKGQAKGTLKEKKDSCSTKKFALSKFFLRDAEIGFDDFKGIYKDAYEYEDLVVFNQTISRVTEEGSSIYNISEMFNNILHMKEEAHFVIDDRFKHLRAKLEESDGISFNEDDEAIVPNNMISELIQNSFQYGHQLACAEYEKQILEHQLACAEYEKKILDAPGKNVLPIVIIKKEDKNFIQRNPLFSVISTSLISASLVGFAWWWSLYHQ